MLSVAYGCEDEDEPPKTTTPPGREPPGGGPDTHLTALTLEIAESTAAVAPILGNIGIPAVFTAEISGFKNAADAGAVTLKLGSVNGLSISSDSGTVQGDTKTFVVTVSHDGTTPLGCNEASVSVEPDALPAGYRYSDGAKATQILIRTGANKNCRILVNQNNIRAFNNYAKTSHGAKLHYALMENVELTTPPLGQSNWEPIGSKSGYTATIAFTGSFDGNGFSINNLVIHTKEPSQGLFGHISEDAVIENLGLTNVNITSSGGWLGGLVGEKRGGTVRNCSVTGTVTGASSAVGGLVGQNKLGSVENSYADVTVKTTGASYGTGGLVGSNDATVKNCYAKGSVSSTGSRVGGVVGENFATVQDCYATNTVASTAVNSQVGGVVGHNNASGTLTNSYSTGNVTGIACNVGGIAGGSQSDRSYVRNSVALNSRVVSIGSNTGCGTREYQLVGRIFGYDLTTLLVNNYAREDMDIRFQANANLTGGNNKTFISFGGQATNVADRMDGKSVSKNEYGTSSFWEKELCFYDLSTLSDVCWDFKNVWTWGDNNLPILRKVGGTQDHKVQ